MTKLSFATVCAIASIAGFGPQARADGPGPVVTIVEDERPCLFFQTNSIWTTWYAIPLTNGDTTNNPWNISTINKDNASVGIHMSKAGAWNVGFYTDGRLACGVYYAAGLSVIP